MIQTKWLESVMARIAALPPESIQRAPELGQPKPGEQVIGAVPETLRPLALLSVALTEEINMKARMHQEDPKHGEDPAACQAFNDEWARLKSELDAVNSLFFASLHYELGTQGKRIALRDDFAVVEVPDRAASDPFGGMFGMMDLDEEMSGGEFPRAGMRRGVSMTVISIERVTRTPVRTGLSRLFGG